MLVLEKSPIAEYWPIKENSRMDIILAIIIGLLGLAIGSFLNVCIDRLPANEKLSYPPSHCGACQHPLHPIDLIPVISYLLLRGKCRYCGAGIPQRILWVELTSALMFATLFWFNGLTVHFAVLAFYYCVLTVIFVIDMERQLILNKIVYPVAIISLLISVLTYEDGMVAGLVQSLIGMGVGVVIILLVVVLGSLLLRMEAMGMGDVKMAGLMGLMLLWQNFLVALMLAIVGAGLLAIALLIFKRKGRKDAIAFGPFLAVGTFVALLWGTNILDWYLALNGLR